MNSKTETATTSTPASGDNLQIDPQLRDAYGRSARFVLCLYNGKKAGRPEFLGDSFISTDRLRLENSAQSTKNRVHWHDPLTALRIQIEEEIAYELGAAIFIRSLRGWTPADAWEGLGCEISPGWSLSIGAQVEYRLSREAAKALDAPRGRGDEIFESPWLLHVFRMGQHSILKHLDRNTAEGGYHQPLITSPDLSALFDSYNEAARVLIRFWKQVCQIAGVLSSEPLPEKDPSWEIMEAIFNKRFSAPSHAEP